MDLSGVCIESFGHVVPPHAISSADIEQRLAPLYQRLRLPEGRLELMTGIRERHFWDDPRIQPSDAAAMAGRACLEHSRFAAGDIDLLVHCAVCRDRLEPATAAYVHGLLGLGAHCQIFDVSNACLGFLNGMVVAASMIRAGAIRRALLVSGENGLPLLEHTLRSLLEGGHDRKSIKPWFANLTIGAGAVACVLAAANQVPQPLAHLGHAVVETDSSANQLCQGDSASGGSLEMLTDAERLLDAGLGVAARAWQRFGAETGWTVATPDRVICHQVGRTHQRKLLEALGIDEARDFVTYPFLGNVGSVSLPITLAMAIEQGALAPGGKAALLGIGSGLSSIMMSVERPEQ